MSNQSVNPAIIDWANKETKRKNDALVRQILASDIAYSGPDKSKFTAITFPAAQWLWEAQMADGFPSTQFEVLGVERNEEVFKRTLKNADLVMKAHSNLKVSTCGEPTSFHKALELWDGDPFDIVYPDYMGTWSQEKKADMELLFEKGLLAKDGFLLFTIALNRGRPKTLNELMEYVNGDYDITIIDNRPPIKGPRARPTQIPKTYGVAGFVCSTAESYGMQLHAFPVHIYYNTTRKSHTPEALFIFKRVE